MRNENRNFKNYGNAYVHAGNGELQRATFFFLNTLVICIRLRFLITQFRFSQLFVFQFHRSLFDFERIRFVCSTGGRLRFVQYYLQVHGSIHHEVDGGIVFSDPQNSFAKTTLN